MSLNLIPHTATPLADLLTRAAFAPIENVGWIRVTGEDRVRWLNGMATNNIAALKPGEGCYNFFLNAQGRIQGDATAWMLEDSILLETAADRIPALMAMLDHFIIMDDVELQPVPRSGLLIAGTHAPAYLHALSLPAPAGYGMVVGEEEAEGIDVIHAHSTVVPLFELWSSSETIANIAGKLRSMIEAPSEATPESLNDLRILSGTPLYGVDIRNSDTAKDLPQETNQTRALHFSKGCYLGQEIVERIRSRGAVHRTFWGFILTGDLPEPGATLHDPTLSERPIGELTSVARIQLPGGPVQLALGYIRREALDRHATITYNGGTATPAALPFQLPELRA
jgi:aminomethyltransferase